MKNDNHPRADMLYFVVYFIDDNSYFKKYCMRFFLFFVGCVNGVQCVCAQIVAILHIETFVTFDFDPT